MGHRLSIQRSVAFILVIFIVLAANFQRIRGPEVALPSAEAPNPADSRSLTVTVPAAGPLKIEGKSVPIGSVRAALQALKSRYDSILLLADRHGSGQRAVQVLAETQAVGFVSVGIATEGQQGGAR